MQDLIDTQGLGHTNSKQPIQYHLRLKNELEELRSECIGLLKEKFQLEQCVRCGSHNYILLKAISSLVFCFLKAIHPFTCPYQLSLGR